MLAWYNSTDRTFNRLNQIITPLIHYHKPCTRYQKHPVQSFGTHRELAKLTPIQKLKQKKINGVKQWI